MFSIPRKDHTSNSHKFEILGVFFVVLFQNKDHTLFRDNLQQVTKNSCPGRSIHRIVLTIHRVTSVLAKKFIGNIHKAFINVHWVVLQFCISTRKKIDSMLQSLTSRQKKCKIQFMFCTKSGKDVTHRVRCKGS